MSADTRPTGEREGLVKVLHDNGVGCEMHTKPREWWNAHLVHADRLLAAGVTLAATVPPALDPDNARAALARTGGSTDGD